MKRITGTIVFLAGLGCAFPVAAAPSVGVKCGANQERVWVYDNLSSWDVSMRLKCGSPVDILGLEKGYVKIRTADGNEGYVAPDAIPSTEVAALTAAAAATVPTPATASAAVRVQQPTVAPAVPIGAPVPVAAAMVQTAPQPAPVTVVAAVAPVQQNVAPAAVTPEPAPVAAPVYVASATSAPVSARKPSVVQPTIAPTVPAHSAAVLAVATTNVPIVPAPVVSAPPQQQSASVRATAAPVATATHSVPPAHPAREEAMLVIEPTVESAVSESSESSPKVVRAADFTPVSKRSMPTASIRTPEFSDDDAPEIDVAASQLANCSVYFSAYGVTPMQYKWISGDLRKRFPGVCPAPEPSMVDYVVILTHDMDFFTTTLPDPVHTDHNGFSDWSPVTAVDDAQISTASLDKAHREYAWVFRVHRGTFNPASFTSRRKPQFTKTESKSSKSIEDAMEFIAGNGSGQ